MAGLCRSTCPTSPPTSVGWWRPTARRPERGPPPAPTGRRAAAATRARTRRRSRPSWTGPATAWTSRLASGSTEGHHQDGTEPPLAMAVKWETSPGPVCHLSLLSLLQVFCGKIPKDIYEDELIPHFEKCGKIWDLRLMMDPMTGLNRWDLRWHTAALEPYLLCSRGYAFITFTNREEAYEAVKQVKELTSLGLGDCSHDFLD